jgi:ribosomal protein S18 acetylase RimI-like enzyme
MIRPAKKLESEKLVQIGISTGLFSKEDADLLLGQTLSDFHSGTLGDRHQCLVWTEVSSDEPMAWAYIAPTPKSNEVWDLWWIGVNPKHQKSGIGTTFLQEIESAVRASNGRLLVIETSSLEALEGTRRFYKNRGYEECGRIPDFYGPKDHKVIFAKSVIYS